MKKSLLYFLFLSNIYASKILELTKNVFITDQEFSMFYYKVNINRPNQIFKSPRKVYYKYEEINNLNNNSEFILYMPQNNLFLILNNPIYNIHKKAIITIFENYNKFYIKIILYIHPDLLMFKSINQLQYPIYIQRSSFKNIDYVFKFLSNPPIHILNNITYYNDYNNNYWQYYHSITNQLPIDNIKELTIDIDLLNLSSNKFACLIKKLQNMNNIQTIHFRSYKPPTSIVINNIVYNPYTFQVQMYIINNLTRYQLLYKQEINFHLKYWDIQPIDSNNIVEMDLYNKFCDTKNNNFNLIFMEQLILAPREQSKNPKLTFSK